MTTAIKECIDHLQTIAGRQHRLHVLYQLANSALELIQWGCYARPLLHPLIEFSKGRHLTILDQPSVGAR